MTQLDRIEKLLAEATPGPLEVDEMEDAETITIRDQHQQVLVPVVTVTYRRRANYTLWASAPEALRQLLAVARAAEERCLEDHVPGDREDCRVCSALAPLLQEVPREA